ncbi:MAG: type II toxin-antitoxin system RelE/ParE family toxin [Sedimentisphaerales bacterium]|nr:type II toxin-antitoxin system RelE/ParE family toxin [Sedimentisphaerales bacterium]
MSWTPQAADDLDSIAGFIAQNSPHYAAVFVMDVLQTADRLVDFPQSGRIVPEVNDPVIREIVIGSYRVIYRLRGDFAEILTVHHGARLLDPSRLN